MQVFGELRGIRTFRVKGGDRVWNSVLAQVVAGRHLSAKTVTAEGDRHLGAIVGGGLNQDRNAEVGEAERVRNGALFTEIRQSDDYAVNAVTVLLE